MFERFRKSRDSTDTGAVATREREMERGGTSDRELDESGTRVARARFERKSPGERDRSVAAGGGDADLASERSFEHEDMARGGEDRADTALDRERARADLGHDDTADNPDATYDRETGRGDVRGDAALDDDERAARERSVEGESPGERDRGVSAGGGAATAAAAGGAAMAHHDHREAERDEAARDRDYDDDRTMARDRDDDGDRDRHHGVAGPATAAAAAGGAAAMAHHHHREAEREEAARDREYARDRDYDYDDDRTMARDRALERDRADGVERHAPVLHPDALDTMRARQRDTFGGIQWGSDFFGWLCAIGLASILTAALVGAGVALGLSTSDASNADAAQQIGLGGGIALLVVLAIAWFCGGYVAGRMARFDGARQGIGVWLWTILAAVIVAALAAIGGSEYDVFQRLNLPRIAVGDDTLTAGGAIAGAAAIVVTLLFAVIGGKVGERYHRRVDRIATDEYVVER
jgi:hypothetical protein